MASVKRERIARKALESIRDTSFWCTIYEIGGEWREQDMMDLSAEEIRFLLDMRSGFPGHLLDGLEKKDVRLRVKITDLAYEVAKQSGKDTGRGSYDGESEPVDHYLFSWTELVRMILDGEVTEKSLDDWLEYFNHSGYDYMDIGDWAEQYGLL